MVRGGVDSRVRMTMTTEGEVDDIRGIQDMGVGTKRKEDQSSSNLGKKQKTSVSQGYLGQELQAESSGQAGQMTCYHYCQPGHMRRDCSRRQRSHSTKTESVD